MYAQSHAVHWTQDDKNTIKKKAYTKKSKINSCTAMLKVTN